MYLMLCRRSTTTRLAGVSVFVSRYFLLPSSVTADLGSRDCSVRSHPDVSVFKAQWCPAPNQPLHFTVASMDRELELYSPEGEILAALTGSQVSAVPAITASHPGKP